MASVFKRGKNKGKKGTPWHFEYLDEHGKRRMKTGFTDKEITRQLASKLETEAKQRRLGLIDSEMEAQVARKQSPIEQQLEAFEKSLRSKKNTTKHVTVTMARTRRIILGCEWTRLGEMQADDVEGFLLELQEEEDIGNRTYNHYLQAIHSFGNWLIHPNRRILKYNPFAGIPRQNPDVDVRHPRRALTADEFSQLLQAARNSDFSVQCYTGEERARIYTVSYMTGLRKGELASLTKGSFKLLGKQPTVTVEAGASKHRRKDVLPLHSFLVASLRVWLKDLKPDDPLFPKLGKRKAWKLVQKDLELAGIPYRTADGIADFHAAGRHTFITELLRNGASLPEAKELARHSSIQMTMKYAHIGIEDQARALAALPAPVQDICRNSGGVEGQRASQDGTEKHHQERAAKRKTP